LALAYSIRLFKSVTGKDVRTTRAWTLFAILTIGVKSATGSYGRTFFIAGRTACEEMTAINNV